MPRKTVPLYEGDDYELLADLRTQVEVAERRLRIATYKAAEPAETPRAGDDEPEEPDEMREVREAVQAARDTFDKAVDGASERAEEWELTHIGHEAWLKLLSEHEARKVTEGEGDEAKQVTHPDDQDWADVLKVPPFNSETFGRALLLFVDPDDDDHRTVTKLGGADPAGMLAKRVRRLSKGQLDTLWVTAHQLNTGGVSDPKLLRYSTAPKSSES